MATTPRKSARLALVTEAPAPKAARAPRAPSAGAVRAQRHQLVSGGAVMAVAAVLTALSLSHLAHGIAATTGAGAFDSWAMAVGIDAGFVAVETAALFAVGAIRAQVERWAKPTVLALVALSMALNAFAFVDHAPTALYAVVAGFLGAVIPALVYVLTRIGFVLLTARK